MLNPDFWKDKNVFVTGHTGFKGSWLCLWLHKMGARVSGFSLPPPTEPSLFQLARIIELAPTTMGDVRDLPALEKALAEAKPEIVIHMAAQSLVRYSYEFPIETFSTNVLGAVNVLDAIRRTPSVKAVVMVTSDKCYHNEEWIWSYREDSKLGGADPYSASKGCEEIVVGAYQHSYFSPRHGDFPSVASARAGNVIGGGDWATDRLIPDILRSLIRNEPTLIRNPHATRPWQHVLEPLHGYLILCERLFNEGQKFATAWNFGPSQDGERPVSWIVENLYQLWGAQFEWKRDERQGPREATFLSLDSKKARALLGWAPKLDLRTSLHWIVQWTRRFAAGEDVRAASMEQIGEFMDISVPDDCFKHA